MCWITSRLNLLWVPLKSSHLTPPLFFQDTLQINKGSGPTRYRLRMSDGRHLWSGKYLKLSSLAVMLIQRMIELIYFIFQRCTFVCVCFMCSVPARHTIKPSFGRETVGSTLCVFAQEDHNQHIIRWQVCIHMYVPSIFSSAFAICFCHISVSLQTCSYHLGHGNITVG